MSPATHIIRKNLNPIPGRDEMRTKIWGVKCVTGLRYKQIGMKKYCITQAVLEPNPYMKDEGNFVSVMVVHNNGEEHLMAVLRHGQIYQVNLNMLFDRDKDVAFYLVGRGTVYLLGYEVILPKKVRNKESSPKGVEELSEPEIEEEDDDDVLPKVLNSSSSETSPPQKRPKSLKSGKKKKKSVEQVAPEVVEMIDDDNNNDDNNNDEEEEDSDFCVGDDEFESSESEDSDDASEEEVEVDDSEIEALVAEITIPELIPTSKKRKLSAELKQTPKRSKMTSPKKSSTPKKVKIVEIDEEDELVEDDDLNEDSAKEENSSKEDSSSKEESSSKEDSISKEEITEELSESDAATSCNGTPKTASNFEEENSTEKKKKKKKKKKNQNKMVTFSKNIMVSNESPSSKTLDSEKSKNEFEIQDMKIGHGPTATRGKMVHVFYVGRLSDKTIFDSRLPGKKPLSFKIGTAQVIKGLEKGVEGMKAGGKRRIQVPPNLAYGNKSPSGIPPNSTLNFIVDLQAVS